MYAHLSKVGVSVKRCPVRIFYFIAPRRPCISHISFVASTELAIIFLGFTKRYMVSPSRKIRMLKLKVIIFPVTNRADVERAGRLIV